MKKRLSILLLAVLAIVVTLMFVSCSNEDEPQAKSRIQLKLTDAPSFLYSQVNIDIQGIDVYVGNTMQGKAQIKDGWLKLNLESTGVVNLLDLMNGNYKLLVDQEIHACEISKVRFNLGTNCSVKSLFTDKVSVLKTNGSFTFTVDWKVEEGGNYSYIIDIDAAQSVTLDLQFNPEPYIRAIVETMGGNVSGYIHPATAVKYIEITNGKIKLYTIVDLIAGSVNGTDQGYFAYICLQPGDWTMKIVTKSTSGYQSKEVPVTITAGKTYKFSDVIELSK